MKSLALFNEEWSGIEVDSIMHRLPNPGTQTLRYAEYLHNICDIGHCEYKLNKRS